MSAAYLTVSQEELVKKAALESGFKEFDIVFNSGSSKGDNYLGMIHTVSVKESNTGEELHLILKYAHTNEVFRKEAVIDELFKREAYLYSTVIPGLLKLQDQKALSHPFTGTAKFYGSCLEDRQESILMQNLKKYGYKLWDRMKPMDDEHITLVFTEYARLHAASLAFKQLHPEEFKELTKGIEKHVFGRINSTDGKKRFESMINSRFTTGLNSVRNSPKCKEVLERLRNNMPSLFDELRNEGEDKFIVTHGDCWCNNMLFKYEDKQNRPIKVCFIDWQLSKLGSPITDLSYFFCVSCSKGLFTNLNKYLSTYHQALSHNLREFGCDPDKIFSFEVLRDEWKKKAWYGVYFALMIIKLMLSDPEEAPNISEMNEENNDIMVAFVNFNTSKAEEVDRRICDLIEFMADNNYI